MKLLSCKWRKQFLLFLLIACLLYILIGLFIVSKFPKEDNSEDVIELNIKDVVVSRKDNHFKQQKLAPYNNSLNVWNYVEKLKKDNLTTVSSKIKNIDSVENLPLSVKISYNTHIFYYPWYGNPKFDGKYYHWNHDYLPHWNKDEAKKYQTGTHVPPDDIGANFYPQLGLYSSSDPDIIHQHMAQMQRAGTGVCVVSWYPPGQADQQGKDPDSLIPSLLNIAEMYRIKVAFHIEPYKNRTPQTLRDNIKYILNKYGSHESFYRYYNRKTKKYLPLYYIYDSYDVPPDKWAQIFQPNGAISVRQTDLDGIFIGLFVQRQHRSDIVRAGFDGFYTYFAVDRFSYGSTWAHWIEMMKFAKERNKIFIPSIGPGYIDTRVRPWNSKNTRNRDNGTYYMSAARFACNVLPDFLSITSFNEWHEGTQIEPAVNKKVGEDLYYLDYGSQGPNYYLDLTRKIVDKFLDVKKQRVV